MGWMRSVMVKLGSISLTRLLLGIHFLIGLLKVFEWLFLLEEGISTFGSRILLRMA